MMLEKPMFAVRQTIKIYYYNDYAKCFTKRNATLLVHLHEQICHFYSYNSDLFLHYDMPFKDLTGLTLCLSQIQYLLVFLHVF